MRSYSSVFMEFPLPPSPLFTLEPLAEYTYVSRRVRARTHTHARVMGLAFQRIVSFPLYFPLFLPFFLLSLSLFLSLFFFGRALSSCIGSVLLIVTALGRRGREREGGGKGSFGSISRMKTRRRVPT